MDIGRVALKTFKPRKGKDLTKKLQSLGLSYSKKLSKIKKVV